MQLCHINMFVDATPPVGNKAFNKFNMIGINSLYVITQIGDKFSYKRCPYLV